MPKWSPRFEVNEVQANACKFSSHQEKKLNAVTFAHVFLCFLLQAPAISCDMDADSGRGGARAPLGVGKRAR